MDPQSTARGPAVIDRGASERDQETRFVLRFVEDSDNYRRRYVDVWDEVLQNYLVTQDLGRNMTPLWTWRNSMFGRPPRRLRSFARLKDPETHQIIETLAAQGLTLLLGDRNYCQAVPVGVDDPDKARLVSRLIMAVLEEPGVFRTNYQTLKDSFIFGTAIWEVGWDQAQRVQVVPGGQRPVQFRNRPRIGNVDIYDFYPDPTGTRIQEDMIGVAKRFRISRAQARDLARQGVYDPQAVERAISRSNRGHQGKMDRYGQERFRDDIKNVDPDTGSLVGFEYWGRVNWTPLDGADNRVITLLESERVRSHINPFIDGNIPFKEVVCNPLAGRFYGVSPAEVIRFIQDATDNLLMVTNDAADLAAHTPLLMGAAAGIDPERLKARMPHDVIPCSNPEAVKPLQIDLNALQFASNDLMRRKLTMREASGATNPLQAIGSQGDQTATEISELVRLASQRVGLMVQVLERDAYPWLGRTILSRIRQFGDPMMIATLEGEPFPVRLQDIAEEADVRFVGSLQAISKFQNTARYREALNVLGNMDILAMYPQVVTRYLRDGLDIVDAEVVVKNALQQYQIKMLMEQMTNMAQGGGQTPKAAPQSNKAATAETFGTQAGQTESEGQRVA